MILRPWRPAILITAVLIMLAAIGCGGGGSAVVSKPSNANPQNLVDPSGNWRMTFTDSTGNTFLLSALFNQTGPVVTGANFSEVGNGVNFGCAAQRDISMANGLVQNVNQFSGDLSGNFGSIHFSSTLNDAGTHADGVYTITPPHSGNCLGVALTGSFIGDEVPSLSGEWKGATNCIANCPVGVIAEIITMSLHQDDATGAVTGTYTIGGQQPSISGGNFVPDPNGNNFISGASIQQKLLDNNGTSFFLVGGPFETGVFTSDGLRQNRTFQGFITVGGTGEVVWSVNMSH